MSLATEGEVVCIGERWEANAEVFVVGTAEGVHAHEAGKVEMLFGSY